MDTLCLRIQLSVVSLIRCTGTMKMYFRIRIGSILIDGLSRRVLRSGIGISSPSLLVVGDVRARSKFQRDAWFGTIANFNVRSLAMVEMKTLLREVYSHFQTTVAPDMNASMEIDDQIISSRPKGQTCKLVFTPI